MNIGFCMFNGAKYDVFSDILSLLYGILKKETSTKLCKLHGK